VQEEPDKQRIPGYPDFSFGRFPLRLPAGWPVFSDPHIYLL